MADLAGKTLQKYLIEELIGKGGMAEVYRAFQPNLQRHVAIKVMHQHLTQNPDFVSSFEREATAVARLRHPNIVRVHDFDVIQNLHFMVMEHIDGRTLKRDIDQRKIAKEKSKDKEESLYKSIEIAYTLSAIGNGLDYAHAQGIIHRDLKPSNIMFTSEGQAVITDFGLAQLVEQQNDENGMVMGTPAYMSPEQAQGQQVDHRSDIYTLGVILYEMLTGHTPHHEETEFSRMVKQVSHAPLPLNPYLQQNQDVAAVIAKALEIDPSDRYQSAGDLAKEYREAVDVTLQDLRNQQPFIPIATDLRLIQTDGQPSTSRRRKQIKKRPSPYRGLFAFREEDAEFFFGRDQFVKRLVDTVNTTQIVPIIGPSGSGKSSVLYAGLVPQLRKWNDWLICSFRPGERPFNALSTALAPLMEPGLSQLDEYTLGRRLAQQIKAEPTKFNGYVNRLLQHYPNANHVLFIVDQFEELFTLCQDEEERQAFITCFVTPRLSNTYAFALSLRADFLGQALRYPGLTQALQENPNILGAMSRDALTEVVIKPAARLDIMFERGLVERILDDVGFEPGNLPLLEFALDTLWDKQEYGILTHDAYESIGRVDGALTGHAEKVYKNVTTGKRKYIQNIFTQLVRPGLGTQDTRRLAKRSEIGERDWPLVQQLANERLVVTNRTIDGQETAEVVHEALIGRWQRLRDWMNQSRTFRMWQERARAAIHQWEENEHDTGSLLRGSALTEAEDWAEQHPELLNETEALFINESIKARDDLIRARELRRRRITGGLATALLIMVVLSISFFVQRNQAITSTEIAEQQRDEAEKAQSRQLAVQSNLIRDADFDLSLLLSVQANEIANTFEARDNLIDSLVHNQRLLSKLRGHDGFIRGINYSHSGELMATGGIEGNIIVWETDTNQPISVINQAHDGPVRSLGFNTADTLIASVGDKQGVRLWNFITKEPIGSLGGSVGQLFTYVAFDPTGNYLVATEESGSIYVWSAKDFTLQGLLQGHEGQIVSTAFSPDGRMLATASIDRSHIVWNLDSLMPIGNPVNQSVIVWDVTFSPNGTTLATSNALGQIKLWDAPSGTELFTLSSSPDWVTAVEFSPNGDYLASGERDGRINIWNISRRQLDVNIQTLEGHEDIISNLTFSPDGERLLSASQDGTSIVWSVDPFPPVGPLSLTMSDFHRGGINGLVYSADGRTMISGSEDGTFVFWDMTQNPPIGRPRYSGTAVNVVDYSPDGRYIATGGEDTNVILWDAILEAPFETPLSEHESEVTAITFSPTGDFVVSGDATGNIIVWDSNTRQLVRKVTNAHSDAVRSLAFHPETAVLVSSSADKTIQVWDIESGERAAPPLTQHQASVQTITFSEDGQYFASGGEDRIVFVWDGNAIAQLGFNNDIPEPISPPLIGNDRRVNTLRFNPEGTVLASGNIGSAVVSGIQEQAGNDTVTLWNLENFSIIGEPFITRHGRVLTLAFSPDGQILASGGTDGDILLWAATPQEWERLACQRVNRDFSNDEWDQFIGSNEFTPPCTEHLTEIISLVNE